MNEMAGLTLRNNSCTVKIMINQSFQGLMHNHPPLDNSTESGEVPPQTGSSASG